MGGKGEMKGHSLSTSIRSNAIRVRAWKKTWDQKKGEKHDELRSNEMKRVDSPEGTAWMGSKTGREKKAQTISIISIDRRGRAGGNT